MKTEWKMWLARRYRAWAAGMVASLLWLSCGHAMGAIYRWLSPDGVVSYGENPPGNARQIQSISGSVGPSAASPSATGRAGPLPATAPTKSAAPAGQKRETAMLRAQLAVARLQLVHAVQAYEQGKRVRYGNEHNYVRYLDRVRQLRAAVQMARMRVLLLTRQLAQVQGARASGSG